MTRFLLLDVSHDGGSGPLSGSGLLLVDGVSFLLLVDGASFLLLSG